MELDSELGEDMQGIADTVPADLLAGGNLYYQASELEQAAKRLIELGIHDDGITRNLNAVFSDLTGADLLKIKAPSKALFYLLPSKANG